MESRELNIGRAGEHIVMADLLLRGERAFMTDQGMAYDVVIERDSKFFRLQVKATMKPGKMNKSPGSSYASSTYLFHVKRAGKGSKRLYETKEFEGFALVALDTKEIAYIPFTKQINKTLLLRDRRQQYKQNTGIIAPYFDEFTFERFMEQVAA